MAVGEFAFFPPSPAFGSGILSINGDTSNNQFIIGGTGISVGTAGGTTTITNLNPTPTNSFTIMQTPSGTSPTASSPNDTLTWLNGTGISISGNSLTKEITVSTTGLQPAGNYITALTGDITATGPGSVAATLATVNGAPGTFTYATLTVNGKGLVTSASSGVSPVTTVTASAPLLSSGGTTPNISIPQASGSVNGYLSSTDWTTFNNKQPAGNYITALTGDVTAAGPGSVAGTLATVNSDIGSFTSANITVNAKGLITAAANGSLSNPIIVTKSSNYTLLSSDSQKYFLLDTSGGTFNLTLPAPASGLIFFLKDSTGSFGTNNLTLVRAASEKIDGIAASKVLQTNWGGWSVFSNGTDWFII